MTASGNQLPRVSVFFPDHYFQAAAVLGRAFADDTLFRAIMPEAIDNAQRARRLARVFGVILAGNRRAGQPVIGIIDDSRIAAAAVVEHFARVPATTATLMQGISKIPELVSALGYGGMTRAISVLDTLTRNRPAAPHVYLNFLGADPAFQRRHFGAAILEWLREQVELRRDIAGVYLESGEENVAFYSRAGYKPMGEIFPLGVRMVRMGSGRLPSATR